MAAYPDVFNKILSCYALGLGYPEDFFRKAGPPVACCRAPACLSRQCLRCLQGQPSQIPCGAGMVGLLVATGGCLIIITITITQGLVDACAILQHDMPHNESVHARCRWRM